MRKPGLLLVLTVACGPTTDAPPQARQLELATEPTHAIPDESASEGYLLNRIHQPRILPGPVIGLADQSELVILDTRGALVWRVGRLGNGPGEFRFIGTWAPCPDGGLVAYDMSLRRFTWFDNEGTPRIRTSLETTGASGTPVAIACGERLILATTMPRIAGPGEAAESIGRSDLVLLSAAADLSAPDTVTTIEGGFDYLGLMVPFGGTVTTARLDDGVAYGFTGDSVLHVVGLDGRQRSVTLAGLPAERPVTAELRAARYAHSESVTPRSIWEAELKAIYDGVPWPATLPRWEQFLVDDTGRFWVSEYLSPHETDAPGRRWLVFSAEGRLEGELFVPGRMELFAVQDGLAWVTETGEDETREVRGYAVR
jgi:hypothetical protein